MGVWLATTHCRCICPTTGVNGTEAVIEINLDWCGRAWGPAKPRLANGVLCRRVPLLVFMSGNLHFRERGLANSAGKIF